MTKFEEQFLASKGYSESWHPSFFPSQQDLACCKVDSCLSLMEIQSSRVSAWDKDKRGSVDMEVEQAWTVPARNVLLLSCNSCLVARFVSGNGYWAIKSFHAPGGVMLTLVSRGQRRDIIAKEFPFGVLEYLLLSRPLQQDWLPQSQPLSMGGFSTRHLWPCSVLGSRFCSA